MKRQVCRTVALTRRVVVATPGVDIAPRKFGALDDVGVARKARPIANAPLGVSDCYGNSASGECVAHADGGDTLRGNDVVTFVRRSPALSKCLA